MPSFLLWGLLNAAGYGVGDFFSALGARKSNPKSSILWVGAFVSVIWLVYAVATGAFAFPSPNGLLLAAVVGICFAAGDFLFATASVKGKVAVASPLLGMGGLFAIVFAVLLMGETPTSLQLMFGVLAVAGSVLVCFKGFDFKALEENALIVLPGAFLHGVALTVAKPLFLELGLVNGPLWMELMFLVSFIPFALLWKGKVLGPARENLACAVCYFFGYMAFAVTVSSKGVALAAPIAEIFPVFTVVLSVVLLKETLLKHQWFGIGLAAVALAGLAL